MKSTQLALSRHFISSSPINLSLLNRVFFKKTLMAFTVVSMSSFAATNFAATLTIDCSQGRVFIGYGVNDNETCLGRRDIIINQLQTTEAFTLVESGNRFIRLNAGDTAQIRARMDCATAPNDVFEFEDEDVETVIVESTTTTGCRQRLPDLAPALLPIWNQELGLD